ncbi:hypothetical protein POPTR_010G212501v4 [Populus trichocarpa]|uniref:Uncharacterized protein n=1 Tax=Populus trichocarpa TaxID=3694 RepID=A0ACC0SEN5_POPTR|nr:hypothetical protein POPTR_010G212501v4 [Populus trichocarpa]
MDDLLTLSHDPRTLICQIISNPFVATKPPPLLGKKISQIIYIFFSPPLIATRNSPPFFSFLSQIRPCSTTLSYVPPLSQSFTHRQNQLPLSPSNLSLHHQAVLTKSNP